WSRWRCFTSGPSVHPPNLRARIVVRENGAIVLPLERPAARAPLTEADAVAAALSLEDGPAAVGTDVEEKRRQFAIAEDLAQFDRGQGARAAAGPERDRSRTAAGGARRHAQSSHLGVHPAGLALRGADLREWDALRPLAHVGVFFAAAQVGRAARREMKGGFRALAAPAAAGAEIRGDGRGAPGEHFAGGVARCFRRGRLGMRRPFVYLV